MYFSGFLYNRMIGTQNHTFFSLFENLLDRIQFCTFFYLNFPNDRNRSYSSKYGLFIREKVCKNVLFCAESYIKHMTKYLKQKLGSYLSRTFKTFYLISSKNIRFEVFNISDKLHLPQHLRNIIFAYYDLKIMCLNHFKFLFIIAVCINLSKCITLLL